MASSAAKICPQCGTAPGRGLRGRGPVLGVPAVARRCEDGPEATSAAVPRPRARDASGRGPGARAPARSGRGVVAPTWAMPAELLRQAARRLRLAAVGVGLTFAVGILAQQPDRGRRAGTRSRNAALRNVVAAVDGGALGRHGVARPLRAAHPGPAPAREPRLRDRRGPRASPCSDHLEPLAREVPLSSISWLCVWIVIFPLFVPASPRWALLAGVASASTWPLAYLVGRALGNPAAPLACSWRSTRLEGYIAAGLAMFATVVIRSLQELGCYQLVEKLDHGGMGEIWRARHRMLARPVAVKLIRPELLGVKSPVEAAALVGRFQREAEATAALHSSHTVALHDFGVTPEGAFYYVMELLDGLDLETLVRRFGPVPPERAIHLLDPGVRLAGRGARGRPRPPRREAREHRDVPLGPQVGLRQGAGLRPREGDVDDGRGRSR